LNKLSFAILLLCFSVSVNAQSGDGFTAICEADGVHAYRSYTDISGKMLEPEWTTEERFYNSAWSFHFDGDEFTVSGKPASVLFNNENKMIVLEGGDSQEAATYYLYAINLDIKEITASEANVYDVLSSGIKARIINFSCSFDFH